MIDFTTIQTKPVPPQVVDLQKSNANLKIENKVLKSAIYIGLGVLAVYVALYIYKKHKEDEASKKNQSPRD